MTKPFMFRMTSDMGAAIGCFKIGSILFTAGLLISVVMAQPSIAQTIETVAGTGVHGYNGDNIPATQAELFQPNGLAFDSVGNLFIADAGNQLVRRVDEERALSPRSRAVIAPLIGVHLVVTADLQTRLFCAAPISLRSTEGTTCISPILPTIEFAAWTKERTLSPRSLVMERLVLPATAARPRVLEYRRTLTGCTSIRSAISTLRTRPTTGCDVWTAKPELFRPSPAMEPGGMEARPSMRSWDSYLTWHSTSRVICSLQTAAPIVCVV